MDEAGEIFGNHRVEDVRWLCSLSETELDFLIGLKSLVLQRAKVINRDELAEKFDLRMLRALALVMMEYIKGKLENFPSITESNEFNSFMEGCNLLKCNLGDALSIEEIKACIEIEEKRRLGKRRHGD